MNEQRRSIFSGMQILNAQKWLQGQALIVEDQFVQAIIPEEMIKHHLPARRYEFPSDYYLAPGLIDLHIHGAQGKDVMDGSEDALIAISQALAAEGVTGFLATTMTADQEHIANVLQTISKAMQTQFAGAAILGAHLEGPFIAAAKAGAQSETRIQLPNIELIEYWQRITNNVIKLVTLAPELPGAIPFIQALDQMNIITSVGHTDATYAETCEAIKAGCSQATHLFNAMRGIHQREPGPVVALLLAHNVMAELIVDGFHLHPAIVALCFKLKGKDHLLLVTDAMRAKCLRNGTYELGGQEVIVKEAKVTLLDGRLAGSTLRMPEAIKNMVQFSRCSLIEAIHMASYNPARALGIDHFKGSINVGKLADLVIFNPDLQVMLTMRAGEVVFKD